MYMDIDHYINIPNHTPFTNDIPPKNDIIIVNKASNEDEPQHIININAKSDVEIDQIHNGI